MLGRWERWFDDDGLLRRHRLGPRWLAGGRLRGRSGHRFRNVLRCGRHRRQIVQLRRGRWLRCRRKSICRMLGSRVNFRGRFNGGGDGRLRRIVGVWQQMLRSIENFAALPTTYPAVRNPKLIRYDPEHRFACRTAGNQTHCGQIVVARLAAIRRVRSSKPIHRAPLRPPAGDVRRRRRSARPPAARVSRPAPDRRLGRRGYIRAGPAP